jgi:hypothetical protein
LKKIPLIRTQTVTFQFAEQYLNQLHFGVQAKNIVFGEFQLTESFLTEAHLTKSNIIILPQKHNEEYYFYGRIPQNSEEYLKHSLKLCVLLKVFQTLHFRTKDA